MAGKSYSRFDNRLRVRLNGQWCVYCGEWATQDEHFPPATYSRNGVILPVCRECNGLAGTTWATDFIERVAHVREKLRHKYRNVLESPEWAQWELSELSYSLRQKVQKWQELRKLSHQKKQNCARKPPCHKRPLITKHPHRLGSKRLGLFESQSAICANSG